MSFSQLNLDATISQALNACGYKIPTPIQLQSIPGILEGKDLVASAQTGTGKTAAFVLPALQRITQASVTGKPRILILTPTRELATQITEAAGKYGKFLRFNMVSLVGGMPYRQQLRGLSRSVDIIVATPGRLLDHMQNKRIDLSGIEMLILDEADRMLDMGFIDDVKLIAKATPQNRQTLLFSATVDNRLGNIIKQLLTDPTRIDLSHEKMAPAKIKQEMYIADNVQHKNKLLQHFLTETSIFKAIIFSATKVNADKLAGDLRDQGYAAAALHGDLKQSVRNKTIEQLRRGKIQLLVATDVAARGIDISDVTHVINFDLPKFSEDYVHRIGRTGRAGKEGTAISLALPNESRHLQKIERFVGQKIELSTISGLESKHGFSANSSSNKRSNGKKSHFKNKGGYGAKSESRFGGRSESRFGDKSDSKPRFGGRSESRFGDKTESRFGGRSESRFGDKTESRPRFASKSESRFGDKSESKPRFGGRSESRFGDKSDSKPRFGGKSESRFGDKSDSKPRFAGRSESRFGDKSESKSKFGGRTESKFGRSDSKFSPRSESKSKFGAKSESASEFKNKPGFKPKPKSGFKAKPGAEPRSGGFKKTRTKH